MRPGERRDHLIRALDTYALGSEWRTLDSEMQARLLDVAGDDEVSDLPRCNAVRLLSTCLVGQAQEPSSTLPQAIVDLLVRLLTCPRNRVAMESASRLCFLLRIARSPLGCRLVLRAEDVGGSISTALRARGVDPAVAERLAKCMEQPSRMDVGGRGQ
jgi:hypothetical protein